MLVKTLAMRFGVENADSLVRYQLVDNPYGLARTTLPRLLVDSCFMQTELAAQASGLPPRQVDMLHVRMPFRPVPLNEYCTLNGLGYEEDHTA